MPLYRMHLRDGADELLDPDGTEISPEQVPAAALRAARDCVAGDAQVGRINFRYRIDVEDEAGDVVYSLPFTRAVEIIPAPRSA